MKPLTLLSTFFRAIALIGSVASILSSLYYLYELLDWGIQFKWHFANVGAWGFLVLFQQNLLLLSLFLIVPFWLFVRTDAATQGFPRRRLINSLAGIGVLLFVLAATLEIQLPKFFP
jgi:hypothetical protein